MFEYVFGSMSLNKNWDGDTLINCPKDTEMGNEYRTSTGIVNLLFIRLQHNKYESTGLIIGVMLDIIWTAELDIALG